MPWVGFEPTIPVLQRAKTVHALDRAATVIGPDEMYMRQKMNVAFNTAINMYETVILMQQKA
jgi:hypothetical protein